MKSTRMIRNLMISGLTRKEAQARLIEIEAQDAQTRRFNANSVDLFYSETLRQRVTIPA